jgi:hypothetical protein
MLLKADGCAGHPVSLEANFQAPGVSPIDNHGMYLVRKDIRKKAGVDDIGGYHVTKPCLKYPVSADPVNRFEDDEVKSERECDPGSNRV